MPLIVGSAEPGRSQCTTVLQAPKKQWQYSSVFASNAATSAHVATSGIPNDVFVNSRVAARSLVPKALWCSAYRSAAPVTVPSARNPVLRHNTQNLLVGRATPPSGAVPIPRRYPRDKLASRARGDECPEHHVGQLRSTAPGCAGPSRFRPVPFPRPHDQRPPTNAFH